MKRDKRKIKRITALFISATIMIGTMGSLAGCGKGSDKDSVRDGSERPVNTIAEVSTGEKLYVTVADDGTLIDSSTGRQLTSEEVEKLVEEGVVEITEDGKVVINDEISTVILDTTNTTEGTTGTTTEATTRSTTRESTTERTSEVTTRANTEVTTESTTETTTRATTRETTTESTTEATTRATTRETTTESTTESTTRATTRETTTESTTEATTRATTRETTTESTTEATTEAPVCSHLWVWKTHTEEVWVDPVTHQEPVYDEGWTEYIYAKKYHCSGCGKWYDTWEQFCDHQDNGCHGSWSVQDVLVDTIEHEPEILYWDTITDVPGHYEEIEVKDYQYCSKCGVKK